VTWCSRAELHGCTVLADEGGLSIRRYPGGPTLVRGARLVILGDAEIEVTRRVIALCRCGRARSLPMCDGTHRFVVGFDRDAPAEDQIEASAGATRSDGSPALQASSSA
jgi:CDGSH-type Zn-finger protein